MSDAALLTPERAFIGIGLLFGMLLLLIIPPFQVADEPAHFYRAYQLAEGELIPQRQHADSGGVLPSSLPAVASTVLSDLPFHRERTMSPEIIGDLLFVPLAPEQEQFVEFNNTALYSPVPYAPQVIALFVGRVLLLPPLLLLYTARLAALFTSLALTWLAVRVAPVGKWTFAVLALTPMAVFQRASLSVDNVTNSLALLLLALCLFYAVGPVPRLRTRDVALLALVAVLVALTKQTYGVLALGCCVIPRQKWGGWARYSIGIIIILASCVLASWLWAQVVQHAYAPTLAADAPATLRFDPPAQIAGMRAAPEHFAATLANTVQLESKAYYLGFFGGLGWDVQLPALVSAVYGVFILGVALTDGKPHMHLAWWIKAALSVIGVAGVLAVLTAGYVLWNTVGDTKIWGIQGRYFIPIAPFFALLLSNSRWPYLAQSTALKRSVVLCIVLVLTYCAVVLLNRYYGFA